ncbi:MAG: C39 family peptidase [Phycisphaerales bacterium]
MESRLRLEILPQPDETTCGPTCLHAIYRYYGDRIALGRVIGGVKRLRGGGTMAVHLGCHALQRGYRAAIYTYNVAVWDPSWFAGGEPEADLLRAKLKAQAAVKSGYRLQAATRGYQAFLKLGGRVLMTDLTRGLVRDYLNRKVPILAGVSATYLYRSPREVGAPRWYDDVRGTPTGHFVVLCGYDRESKEVMVADPLHPNPPFDSHKYRVRVDRLAGAVYLGVLTYDSVMLVIEPPERATRPPRRGVTRGKQG